MTPQAVHEVQLATLAGCVEYLSGEPKCQIAARKLMTKLRTEQLKLHQQIDGPLASTVVTPLEAPRSSCYTAGWWVSTIIGCAAFWGLLASAMWMIYGMTGQLINFGGGQ